MCIVCSGKNGAYGRTSTSPFDILRPISGNEEKIGTRSNFRVKIFAIRL